MNAELIELIETSAERAASALLGAAVAFAAYRVLGTMISAPQLVACSAGAGTFVYVTSNFALRFATRSSSSLPFSPFFPSELHLVEDDELVLTDADRLETVSKRSEEQPLVLDDILAEIGPDARVVRLFDRKAMQTPGQLKSRIDDHLGRESTTTKIPDASAALSEALAELRRSLR